MDLSFSYGSIATVSMSLKDFNTALENYQRKLAIQEKVVATDAKNAFAQNSLARTFRQLGDLWQKFEKFDQATAEFQKSIEIYEKLSAADPNSVSQKTELAESYAFFGNFLFDSATKPQFKDDKISRLREAQKFQKRGLEILLTLKSQNTLDKAFENTPTEVQEKLRKTETELANLSGK